MLGRDDNNGGLSIDARELHATTGSGDSLDSLRIADSETMAAAHPTEEWDSKKQQTFVEAGLKDPSTQECVASTCISSTGPR